MKLTKAFTCVLPGEIYPVELPAGEECPKEYEDSARAQGCLGKGPQRPNAEQAQSATAPAAAEAADQTTAAAQESGETA